MKVTLNNIEYSVCTDPTVEQYSSILDIVDKIEIVDTAKDMTDEEKYIMTKSAYINAMMRMNRFTEFLSLILEEEGKTYKDNKSSYFDNVKLSQVAEAIDFFLFSQTSLFPKLTTYLLRALRQMQENIAGRT